MRLSLLLICFVLVAAACDSGPARSTSSPSPDASPAQMGGGAGGAVAPMAGAPAPTGGGESPSPPLRLDIEAPERAAWIPGPSVEIRGRVTGGRWPAIEINGRSVGVGLDGRFETTVDGPPGLRLIHIQASDEDPATAWLDEHRAVMVGADVEPAEPVAQAASVHLSVDGLAHVSSLASDFVNQLDLLALSADKLPDDVSIDALRHAGIQLALVPHDGWLEVTFTVNGLSAEFSGMYSGVEFSGGGSADPVRIEAEVGARVTEDGQLRLEVVRSRAVIDDFLYDLRNVPEFIEDWFRTTVRSTIEDAIEDGLSQVIVPSLFDPAALHRTLEIGAKTVVMDLSFRSVSLRETGLGADLLAHIAPGAVVRRGPALARSDIGARSDLARHIDIGIAGAFIERMMHAAWSGGLLDFTIDQESIPDAPIMLTVGLIGSGLGEAASLVDHAAPLTIRTLPQLPPTVRVQEEGRPLVLEAGEFHLEFADPEGPIVTVALHFTAQVWADFSNPDEIRPDLAVTVQADVVEAHRAPVNEEQLEALVESFASAIPAIIAQRTFAAGPQALPAPLQLSAPSFEADRATGWLHVRSDILQ